MEVTKIQPLVKRVRLRSYSGPYSVRMRENTDQNKADQIRTLFTHSAFNYFH